MQRNRPNERHSRPGDSKERDLSGHGKKLTERGALTSWRQQREGLVRTEKETDSARRTHNLETVDEGTCQNTERNRLSKGNSRPGDSRGRNLSRHEKKSNKQAALTSWRWQRSDLSGHGKKPTKGRVLTSWRQPREGLVKTGKETDRARGTHSLETAQRGACQNRKKNTNRRRDTHFLETAERDLSEHRKKLTERGALRSTHSLETAEGGTCQNTEKNRPGERHSLSGDGRGTCQDTERNRPSKGHSLPGDGRGRDSSGHRKK